MSSVGLVTPEPVRVGDVIRVDVKTAGGNIIIQSIQLSGGH